ncbi:MAG TPA: sensor histidine kinase, partial [Ardenticatenaceae bacterium]|nr:sensor histidine kinase [Ardenticatenaceae bacterium]
IANTRRYEQTDEQLRQKVRELTAVQKKLETSLRLKGALLEELDHRVGNTLMMVKSLLDMQRRRLDPAAEAAHVLSQSIEHILAIADVQRLLRNEDDVVTTVEEIARQVIQRKQSLTANTPVRFGLHVSPISISSHDANLLALVLNELIDNALRHGLAAEGGMVQVEASRDADQLVVEVRDDGPLHPAGTPPPSSGRGHSIIQTLVENQGGSFDFHRDRESARARVCFPYKPPVP